MSVQERDGEDGTTYKVVVNEEEQYSIWPADIENPPGWNSAGRVGPKAECLSHIKEVWTDMRPLSLRKQMEEVARNPPAPAVSGAPRSAAGEGVVERLCAGDHPLVVNLPPQPAGGGFKEAIEQRYLRVKFTDTNPGTELGIRLDTDACDFGEVDFERGSGRARVIGDLTLDYVRVRCVASIDLETLSGQGRLEKIEAGAAGE